MNRAQGLDSDLALRLLPLEGGVNFRDMGGYAALDGRRTRWGRLYRSGTMGRLTDADRAHLATLGIHTVIDLRTASEQEAEPNLWAHEAGVTYWSRPHQEVFGNLYQMLEEGIPGEREAEMVMEEGFRRLPFQQAEAYGEMFRRLAQGHAPLVFNCTAGKDRTGGAGALLLAALDIPRETIIADFTMTERAVDLQKTFRSKKGDPRAERFNNLAPGVTAAVGGARPSYVTALLDAVDEACGSIENYLGDLGMSAGDIDALRDHLLESA